MAYDAKRELPEAQLSLVSAQRKFIGITGPAPLVFLADYYDAHTKHSEARLRYEQARTLLALLGEPCL